MGKTIGAAEDFYRLRVVRVAEPDEPDLEWRDDILYREPPRQHLGAVDSYAIEAVGVDNEDDVTQIALYESSDEAHVAFDEISEDLAELTKSEFEERYFEV